MSISGVYQIQSKCKPERIYIGSSVSFGVRWSKHRKDLERNKHHSLKLQRHYNKYGEGDLQFSVLIGCEKKDLIRHEQFFIDSYNPYFNNAKIAGSNLGCKMSALTCKRNSEGHRGIKQSLETIEKRVSKLRGRKRTEETCLKISLSNTGKQQSEERRNKSRIISANQWKDPIYRHKTTLPHINIKQSQNTINKRRLKLFKPISQLSETGIVLKEWESIIATKAGGFEPGHVSECCLGKRIRAGGFKWGYKKIA